MACLALASCQERKSVLAHEVVAKHPHDSGCYTQGLEFYRGSLMESAGQYGESNVRLVDPKSGKVLRQRPFPASIFAEGLTVLDGKLWVLSWLKHTAFVMDPETFALERRHAYEGEGWGLTNDGKHLIMSNGSNQLVVRNPQDFSVIRRIDVTEGGKPLKQLNELEWVDGAVFANIYTEDRIVRIDAESGVVTGVMDLKPMRGMLPESKVPPEELNGIAWNAETKRLWVTGKYWPLMFELSVTDAD